MTKVMKCTCTHDYQDKKYGKGNRIFNELSEKNTKNWRCTVCKAEKL